MSNKLQAKDLINLGLFTVLYFVIGCCVAIPIGFVPIFLPILGALWSLITGIPFMLFLTRVKKFGMVTIMGILSGLLMGLTGMGFWGVPMGVIFGLLGDRDGVLPLRVAGIVHPQWEPVERERSARHYGVLSDGTDVPTREEDHPPRHQAGQPLPVGAGRDQGGRLRLGCAAELVGVASQCGVRHLAVHGSRGLPGEDVPELGHLVVGHQRD